MAVTGTRQGDLRLLTDDGRAFDGIEPCDEAYSLRGLVLVIPGDPDAVGVSQVGLAVVRAELLAREDILAAGPVVLSVPVVVIAADHQSLDVTFALAAKKIRPAKPLEGGSSALQADSTPR